MQPPNRRSEHWKYSTYVFAETFRTIWLFLKVDPFLPPVTPSDVEFERAICCPTSMSFWHLQLALEYARIVLFSSATIKSIHFTLNPLRTPDFLGMSEWVHGIKHKKIRPGEICMRTMIHYNRNADLCLWIFRGNWRLIVSHLNFLMSPDAHLLT